VALLATDLSAGNNMLFFPEEIGNNENDTMRSATWEYSIKKVPRLNIKANILYGGTTLTPNLAIEHPAGDDKSVEWSGSYNKWNHKGTLDDNKKLNHWIIRGEYRHWFNERYKGHFFGTHVFFMNYNISNYDILWILEKEYRYQGSGLGAGFTYGYHMPLNRRWNLEFHVGAGVVLFDYDKYRCTLCSELIEHDTSIYVGPTRLGVSLIYIID